jgi:hypothetical protein
VQVLLMGLLSTDKGRVAVVAGLTRVPEVGAIALKLFERSRKARDVPRLKMCRSEVIVPLTRTAYVLVELLILAESRVVKRFVLFDEPYVLV